MKSSVERPVRVLTAGLVAGCTAVSAATFTVTTTEDSGAGSLRQAILDANATAAPDVIAFAIPGAGPHIIAPATRLPDLTEPLTIDGFTQPGAAANTLTDGNNAVIRIRLEGAGAFGANGLRLRAPACEVRGLSITGFAGEGVVILGATNCVVAGNYLGLAPDGAARANQGSGVQVFDSPGNRIGGTAPGDRNVLSGNFTAGVHLLGLGASNNVIEGNFIGTSPDGSAARGNFVHGVYVQDAPRNRIGGATPGGRNVISGNTPDGIRISGAESVENVAIGNLIGPDASGAAGLGSQNGVNLESGATNRVGGSAAGEANVIAGNSGFGVGIGTSSSGNLVLGNRIGVGATGSPLPNGMPGIFIRGSANRLGGAAPGEGNEIANNAPGIEVEMGSGNAIRGNSIHDNRPRFAGFGGLGIDLAPFGLTANDAGDGDGGANLLQNFPLLTAASASGASTRVQGTLNSRPNATFALDFFSSPDCDPSGHGEGREYLGAASVATDSGGHASFDVTLPVTAEGRQITATATDAEGNTSEFGPCFAARVEEPPQTFLVTNTNDSGPGSLRQALIDAQASPASGNNVIAFDIPGTARAALRAAAAPERRLIIRPVTPLPSLFEAVTIDGFTQPDSRANSLTNDNNAVWIVRLDGSQLGAGADGLTLGAPGCIVRGLEITGFRGAGIRVTAEGDFSFIEGCHLLNNQAVGLFVDHAGQVTIGGTAPASRNVIHGNGAGIQLSGAGATENVVAGNWIGPDASGAGGSGNFGEGVVITDASHNVIGGTAPGAGNRIAFNLRTGVTVLSGTGNDILGNGIANNVGSGIELFPGANGNLEAPTISFATIRADGVDCAGTFRGQPDTTYTLQTFSSLTPNAGGEFFLGGATATTDGAGAANFAIGTGGNFVGRHLTVTLTGPSEGTSEFSAAITPASVRPPRVFTVRTTANEGPESLRQVLVDADNFLAAGNNVVAFDIPGPGVKVIQPLTPLALPGEPITLDGFTQPGSRPNRLPDGYNGVHLIQLDGARQGGGEALSLAAEGSVLRGLSITRFATGLTLGGAGGHLLEGNLIGVDPLFQPAGNTDAGVEIFSPNNRVGGTNAANRNVIGANGDSAIVVLSTPAGHNEFHGNFFGFVRNPAFAPHPFVELGNREDGIRFRFDASDNRVGGTGFESRNVFGFNGRSAVNVESGQRNDISGNEYLAAIPFGAAADFVSVAPNANGNVDRPRVTFAYSENLNLRVAVEYTGRPNMTYNGEIYASERPVGASWDLRSFVPIHRFNLTTDASGNGSREELIPGLREPFARSFATVRDPAGNGSAASDLVKVVPAASADLKTLFFAPRVATNGVPMELTVVVTNCGPATATNVTVKQVLPPRGVANLFVPAPGEYDGTNGIVTYAVGDLAPGQSRTLTLTVEPRRVGDVQFLAESTHAGADPDWSNAKDVVVTRVVPTQGPQADLQAGVIVPGRALAVGELARFTFLVTNTGPDTATSVRMAIKLPRGALLESVDTLPAAGCEVAGNVISCTRAELAPGQTVAITVDARLTETDFEAERFYDSMSLTAWAATVDPDPGNNHAVESVEVSTQLAIEQEGATARVTWPAPSPGVALQSTTSLTPPVVWTDVPTNLLTIGDSVTTLTIIPQATGNPAAQFFQLAEIPPTEPEAEFDQVSMQLDGVALPFTDWGQVALKLPRSASVRYVNVSYNHHWVIQNVPILSGLLGGAADRFWLNFPLDTNGAPVFLATTGVSVTTETATAPPASTTSTVFGIALRVLNSGEQGVRLSYLPALPLVGGQALETAQAEPGFPNREQLLGESVPSAIVNGLFYLDTVFGLNVPQADIGLETIKEATGWTFAGAPVGDDPSKPDWLQAKAQHLSDRNLPMVSRQTTNVAEVLEAVRAMHPVTILISGHAASVVGMVDLGGGRSSLTLSHDVQQGDAPGGGDGGNVQEVVIFDFEQRRVTGSALGWDWGGFTIDRPL